jgi:phosphoenolpyruvate carboxylase
MDPELANDVRFLTTRLGDIIREQAGQDVFEHVEQIRRLSKLIREQGRAADVDEALALIAGMPEHEAYLVAHAFSLFFQLVNLCEERTRLRRLRADEEPRQSLRSLFRELAEAGVSPERVQAGLDALEIEPVLTAHPTEAKRRSVVYQLWRLREHFDSPDEVLETLWQTEEIHEHKLEPLDEVDNALAFFHRAIFDAVAAFYENFDRELAGRYPTTRRRRAFLTFASWIGGDRDGNPYVTPDVSLETAARHRRCVLAHYREECDLLAAELSHRAAATPPGDAPSERFRSAIRHAAESLRGGTAESLPDRFTATHDRVAATDDRAAAPEAFIGTLRTVQRELLEQNAWRTASGRIERLATQAEVFGFHLAELDFRDNSDKLERPAEIGEELAALRRIQERHGEAAAHRFVLSMTHGAGDIREVLELARQVNVHALDVVPLFETIHDLEAAPGIMRELYADAGYREHLATRGDVQEIMLGYSDSNKDGGYLAANWFVHEAEVRLASLADECGIKLRFFHGKGGSIDRGGGQSYRSLRAQPCAAHGGRIRITEQGEVISLKYSSPEIAERNLEQLTSAVIAATLLPPPDELHGDRLPEWRAAAERLARDSFEFYQSLVYRTPGFTDYFRQATPIDVIERLRLGSRPSRREPSRSLDTLRAIPWVFSWTQSRHLLSAWYGIGSAIERFVAESATQRALLREMYAKWPFFAALLDNAQQSLAKTDMHIAAQYAALVEDAALREGIFNRIRAEYERSISMVLDICGDRVLLAGTPVLQESIQLRNPYVDPLNYLQIHFLPLWRRTDDADAADRLQRLLALTVGGIAFGMKSTG